MTAIVTEIEIAASPERVWSVLTSFAAYDDWNPIMRLVRGEAKPGARLEVRVRFLNGLKLRFHAAVLRAEPCRELRWEGHFLHRRIFSGEHFFLIEPLDGRRVRFIQREVYSGLLRWLILLFLASNNRRAFEAMNRALKSRTESPS